MKDWGKLFRKLRKDRHLTLQEVADNVNSVSFISKFEKGDSQISFNRLIHLLGKINFSVEEFLYINGRQENKAIDSTFMSYRPIYLTAGFMSPLVAFMNDLNISDSDYQHDKDRINQYFAKTIAHLDSQGSSDWHHYLAILYRVQRLILQAGAHPNESPKTNDLFKEIHTATRPIVSYLYNIENWSAFEILLFSVSHFAIPTETVHQLEQIAIKRTTISKTFPMMPQIQFSLLFGLFSTYINFRHMDWAKETLDQIKALFKQSEDAGVAIMLRFYHGWYDYIQSKGQSGIDKMQDSLSIAHILKLTKTAEGMSNMIPLIKKNQQEPAKAMIFVL